MSDLGGEGAGQPCWAPQVVELPLHVRRESEKVDSVGTILYPYWIVDVDVHVKALLLPKIVRRWQAAVDGVTGTPYTLQHVPRVVQRESGTRLGSSGDRVLVVTPFALRPCDIDQSYLERTLLHYASRRFRSWRNVRVEIAEARPVYKEIRVFVVGFRNGSRALLALDTITGEYGVAPAGILLGTEREGTAGEEAGS